MSKYSLPKKRGKNFCDELWTKIVKLEHQNKCPICESLGLPLEETMLNAHHLISRRVFRYRWDTKNGILICPKHHEFDLYLSAHTAPWGFEDWMKENAPIKYGHWVTNRQDLASDGKFEYAEIYQKLEEQYKSITGEYYRIKRIQIWILSQHKEEITFSKKMGSVSVGKLAERYDVSPAVMKKFLAT